MTTSKALPHDANAAMPFPVLELVGSPTEMGRSHGEECREAIVDFLGCLEENLRLSTRDLVVPGSTGEWLNRCFVESQRYDGEAATEVRAIAEGANRPVEEIVFLNAFLDIAALRHPDAIESIFGCTAFGVGPPASDRVIIGQNYDMEEMYRPFARLIRRVESGSASLAFSFSGVLACAGMNGHSLGVCINFLHADDARAGVLHPFVVRNVLRQERIGDAIGAVTIAERAGGMHYLIGSHDGLLCSIETTAMRAEVAFATDGLLAHSNHYCAPSLKDHDLIVGRPSYSSGITRRGSTLVRGFVAEQRLARSTKPIELSSLIALMRSHVNFPYSICFHGSESDDAVVRGGTIASLIFELEAGAAHISNGSEHGDFERFDVERQMASASTA